jgi:hypothetical protein
MQEADLRWELLPNCAVEAAGAEAKALANVLQEKVALYFALKSNLSTPSQRPPGRLARGDAPSMLGATSTPAQM